MKVLHVTTGLSPRSGGPTRSVKGLCRALSKAGIDVTLLVLGGDSTFENPCGVRVVCGITQDQMEALLVRFDLVHLHGLWHLGLHRVVNAARRSKLPYIFSPRGMLDPWALSINKWKKRLGLILYQRRDLRHAIAFHATASAEAEHIRMAGFTQKCIIAPNAVELPDSMPERNVDGRTKTALFLSRLHPGKGLLSLAGAWAMVRPKGWRMKVVGPDSYGHKAEVVAMLTRLGIVDEWEFVDALDDASKWHAYRSADLLVHPSVSENFGITVAEGLAAELPVITTKGTPWQELCGRKCGWWIDVGIEPLSFALKEAMSLPDAILREMGERGRRLVEENYTWEAVVKKMVVGYDQVLAGPHEKS